MAYLPEGGELGEEERVRLERHERELVEHAVGDGQRHHGRRRRKGGHRRGAHRPRQVTPPSYSVHRRSVGVGWGKVSRGGRTLKWNRPLGTENGNWKTMGTAAEASLAAAAWIACVRVREPNVFAFTSRPLDSHFSLFAK